MSLGGGGGWGCSAGPTFGAKSQPLGSASPPLLCIHCCWAASRLDCIFPPKYVLNISLSSPAPVVWLGRQAFPSKQWHLLGKHIRWGTCSLCGHKLILGCIHRSNQTESKWTQTANITLDKAINILRIVMPRHGRCLKSIGHSDRHRNSQMGFFSNLPANSCKRVFGRQISFLTHGPPRQS